MIGKGGTYKSFKEVGVGEWVWVNVPGKEFGDVAQELMKVEKKNGSHPVVRTPSGALMEITNPKALTKVIGEL